MGFEYRTRMQKGKYRRVRLAFDELREWAKLPKISEYEQLWGMEPNDLQYWVLELDDLSVELPEAVAHEIAASIANIHQEKERTEKAYSLFWEYYDKLPDEAEVDIWAIEIPWLWKIPSQIMAKAAELFDKWGVPDIWWDIVREGCQVSDRHFGFADACAEELGFRVSTPYKNELDR